MKRLSQYTRIVESVKSSVKRVGDGVAEVVQANCPPDRPVIHGPFTGQSLRKTIDAGPAYMDGTSLYCGIGDERKMVPWWYHVEHGMVSTKYRFLGMDVAPKVAAGKGKHGEGFMVKSKKGSKRAPKHMFAITYRTQKTPVLFKIHSALKKALK